MSFRTACIRRRSTCWPLPMQGAAQRRRSSKYPGQAHACKLKHPLGVKVAYPSILATRMDTQQHLDDPVSRGLRLLSCRRLHDRVESADHAVRTHTKYFPRPKAAAAITDCIHVQHTSEVAHLWLAWHAGSYPSGEQEHAHAASSGIEQEYLPGDNSPSLIRFSRLC